MEKQKLRLMRVKRKHILVRLLLSLAAVVILLPVVLTALYSFFSPNEIKAFMQTRGSFDAASLMEIKLSPNMFSLSQYYKILIGCIWGRQRTEFPSTATLSAIPI